MDKVIIRKEHICWGCGTKFTKGSLLTSITTFEDGPKTTYWCEPCCAFLKLHQDEFRDGIYMGDFKGEEEYEKFKKEYNAKN